MNKSLFIIFILFFLSGCTGDRCIAADDFGHANFTVPARYDNGELTGQVGTNQVAPWLDSKFRLNGRPLTVSVRGWDNGIEYNDPSEVSAWCPWYGSNKNVNQLSLICARLKECLFQDDNMCTDTIDAAITNAPCLLKKGVGLYAAVPDPGIDINSTYEMQKNPTGIVFHVGEKTDGYSMYEVNKLGNIRETGGRVYNFENDEVKSKYVGGKLYFKILDKYYNDNNGQYKVVVKSGISRVSPDPITYATTLVKGFIFGGNGTSGIVRGIYLGIVNNPSYRLVVSMLLTLYIVYTGLSYLVGNIQLTHTELIVRVVKIAIVSTLLNTEYSWRFFNDYLFVYFIGGTDQILKIIVEAGASGPGSPGILALMIAPQTLAKLLSLLFTDWLGFLYIILFLIALVFILVVFFQATVIYLSSLIAISLILIMAPIFICFLLFEITKPLFESWLKQLIAYSVQPIILFTGLIFISMILRQEIYGSLGFSVCKFNILSMVTGSSSPTNGTSTGSGSIFNDETEKILGVGLGDSIFSWWFPNPMIGSEFSRETKSIPIPIDHYEDEEFVSTSTVTSKFCEAYGCIGQRYIDLPFLDPVKDVRRLNQFWAGRFVQLDGLFLIFVGIYLLFKFNTLATQAAHFLTGTSGNLTKINRIGDAAVSSIMNPVKNQISKMPGRALGAARGITDIAIGKEKRQELVSSFKEKFNKITPSGIVDQVRIRSLKKEALGSGANKAVLQEVMIKTGLTRDGFRPNAIRDYKKMLAKELMKDVDPNLYKSAQSELAKKTASKLAKKDFDSLKYEFAKAKYGKKYKELSLEEKQNIKYILSNKELRTLARDAQQARKFRNAYVDAYISLSDRGVGILGKQNRVLRSIDELKFELNEAKKDKKIKDQQFSDELFSHIGKKGIIDTKARAQNYRMQTREEILQDNMRNISHKDVANLIQYHSRKQGLNVTSPEFLARLKVANDPKLVIFKDLERKDLNAKIYRELSATQAILGEKYNIKYAKDSELRTSLDKLAQAEKKLLKNDEFISRQTEYKLKHELSGESLKSTHKLLSEHFKKDIKAEEMPAMLEKYYKETNLGMTQAQVAEKIIQLQKNIYDFKSSGAILRQIDQRKKAVVEEIDKYTDIIQTARKKAGMEEYQPKRKEVNERKIRDIDDYLRNKPQSEVARNIDRSRENNAEQNNVSQNRATPQSEVARNIDRIRENNAEQNNVSQNRATPQSEVARNIDRSRENNIEQNAVSRDLNEQSNNKARDRSEQIRQETQNILSPENLAKMKASRDPEYEEYSKIARKDLNIKINKALQEEKNAAAREYGLSGNKDAELKNMIERIASVEKQLIDNDEYIKREKNYELTYKLSGENIKADHKLLSEHYKRDIKADEMPALLEKYYAENKPEMSQGAVKMKVNQLEKSIESFETSGRILEQIDARKKVIADEIDKQIGNVNSQRKSGKMEEYNPQRKKATTARKIPMINERLKSDS